MSEVEVSYSALARAVGSHDELAERTGSARGDAEAADLPGASLGKLPESDEILAAFQERRVAAIDALVTLSDSFTAIADGLRATLEQYQAADDGVHQAFGGRGS